MQETVNFVAKFDYHKVSGGGAGAAAALSRTILPRTCVCARVCVYMCVCAAGIFATISCVFQHFETSFVPQKLQQCMKFMNYSKNARHHGF